MHPVLCKIHHALASHLHEFRAYWVCLALLGISANTIPPLWYALQQIGVGIVLLVLACALGWISTELFLKGPRLSSKGKAVLITGCDSGFGYHLAKRLDSEGYLVFAGCLFPRGSGAGSLAQGSERLHVLPLDVTNEQQIRDAVHYVKTNLKGNQLWSVVANAGVNIFLEFEWIRTEDVSRIFDVNVMGVVRTSKAFLPMLRNSRGRLILVSSYAGRIASNMIVPYSMTKAAVISMADGLRREMSKWGVHVCTVEPFYYETAINPSGFGSMMSKFERDVPEDLRADYGEYPEDAFRWFIALLQRISRKDSSEVVNQMVCAVADSEPKRHYRSDGFFNWLLYMSLFVLPSAAQDIACSFIEPHFKADKKSGLLLRCSR